MAASMRDQARRHFHDWVPQNVRQGIDGNDRKMDYVSVSKQKDYWTHDRIGEILGPYDKDVDIDEIQHRFIQVISILTYISDDVPRWADYLVSFYRTNTDDDSLPLPNHEKRSRRSPAPFERVHDGSQAWRHFSENQWKFLPLQLRPKNGIIDRVHPPRVLDTRYIIPVTIESELSQRPGGGARVVKVQPHEASGLQPEKGSIVLKIYDKDRYNREFMQERDIYTTIRNMRHKAMIDVFQYFLGYYGCYIQGNKCVLLIEYANQGSLLEFFRRNWHLPRTKEEAQDLWDKLGQLIRGLALLHDGGKHHSCLHQDIKPANIFVSENGPDGALCFKFGDFGMSSVTPIAEDGDAIGPDNGGTKMYSAPELCDIDQEVFMPENITWGVDIWSFGCVLLDCGVWMALHERGRLKFRKERVEETRSLGQKSLSDAGYDGAFHDGRKILTAVHNKIQEIRGLDNPVADLAAHMMEFIRREMLLSDEVERLNAQQLRTRFKSAIDGPRSPSSSNENRALSLVSRYPSSRSRTSISQPRNSVTRAIEDDRGEEARRHKVSPKSEARTPGPRAIEDEGSSQESLTMTPIRNTRSTSLPHRKAPSPSAPSSIRSIPSSSRRNTVVRAGSTVANGSRPEPFRNRGSEYTIQSILEWIPKHKARQAHMLEWLEQPRKRVRGRDQVFVFDNSESMDEHWPDVKCTGDALTYVLKDADPDGFEIYMTNAGEPIKRKDRKGLFDKYGYFDNHRPRPGLGPCPMEAVLSQVLGAAVKKALAPPSTFHRMMSRKIHGVSVYVFTNGVWESQRSHGVFSGEASGVEKAIKSAVERLQNAGEFRTFLSIQFIRFGEDPEGRRRMEWLDDDIEIITGGWDIVDTTHHTESAKKMIIGAISSAVDG